MPIGTVVIGASAAAVCVAVLTAVSSKFRPRRRNAITEAFEQVSIEVNGKVQNGASSSVVDGDGKAMYDFIIVGGGQSPFSYVRGLNPL